MSINDKLEQFRALVQADTKARYIAEYGIDNFGVHELHTVATIKPGKKYTKVDVGRSGKYMVEMDTGRIFGIKAYGVIHRGHQYGDLDSIAAYDWGGYVGVKRNNGAA
jgi:hypothetical protein